MVELMLNDEELMWKAIKLALKGSGYVSPNPRVGAVIVKNGEIIAEGYHSHFGGEHAEINAIKNSAIDSFDDATLYVNLEPCSHQGKTPPCVNEIIERKFKRVVIGMVDPNPLVSGSGIKMLEEAGIDVKVGVLEQECKWLNRFFIKHITSGLPYVILKSAVSLDGFIATTNNESKWISSEESRRRVHILRSTCDAVLIGRKTAEKDNPSLTVRHINGRNPKRVLLDTNLISPLNLNLFTDEFRENTIVVCSESASQTAKAETLKSTGVSILTARLDKNNKIDLVDALLKLSNNHQISSVLVEGGSSIFSSFIHKNIFDELQIFISNKIFGNGIRLFNDWEALTIDKAMYFKLKAISRSDTDIHLIALRNDE